MPVRAPCVEPRALELGEWQTVNRIQSETREVGAEKLAEIDDGGVEQLIVA